MCAYVNHVTCVYFLVFVGIIANACNFVRFLLSICLFVCVSVCWNEATVYNVSETKVGSLVMWPFDRLNRQCKLFLRILKGSFIEIVHLFRFYVKCDILLFKWFMFVSSSRLISLCVGLFVLNKCDSFLMKFSSFIGH